MGLFRVFAQNELEVSVRGREPPREPLLNIGVEEGGEADAGTPEMEARSGDCCVFSPKIIFDYWCHWL